MFSGSNSIRPRWSTPPTLPTLDERGSKPEIRPVRVWLNPQRFLIANSSKNSARVFITHLAMFLGADSIWLLVCFPQPEQTLIVGRHDSKRPVAAGRDSQLAGCTIHCPSAAVRGGRQCARIRILFDPNASPVPVIELNKGCSPE
jgi:hypothetical protein